MATSLFLNVAPLVPAGPNLADALALYQDELGFRINWKDDTSAIIQRGNVSFMLVRSDNRDWADNASFSIGVNDLESLYLEFLGTSARVGPLETKPWGRREFHMIVPSGVCFQFHEADAKG